MKALSAVCTLLSAALCTACAVTENASTGPTQSSVETSAELQRLRSEQTRLLEEVRAELARLPPVSDTADNDSLETRNYRKRRDTLIALLREIEDRINLEASVRSVYVSSRDQRPPLLAYYERVRARIEVQGTKDFPTEGGKSAYGRATVIIALDKSGNLEYVEVVESSSQVIADHAVRLVRQLAPFEPFKPDVAKLADRIVIGTRFSYVND